MEEGVSNGELTMDSVIEGKRLMGD